MYSECPCALRFPWLRLRLRPLVHCNDCQARSRRTDSVILHTYSGDDNKSKYLQYLQNFHQNNTRRIYLTKKVPHCPVSTHLCLTCTVSITVKKLIKRDNANTNVFHLFLSCYIFCFKDISTLGWWFSLRINLLLLLSTRQASLIWSDMKVSRQNRYMTWTNTRYIQKL